MKMHFKKASSLNQSKVNFRIWKKKKEVLSTFSHPDKLLRITLVYVHVTFLVRIYDQIILLKKSFI